MRTKWRKFGRIVISTIRRKGFDIWDRLGLYAELLAILVIGMFFFVVISIRFHIGGPSDWAAFAGGIILAATTVFLTRRRSRQQAILIEVVISYLIAGGRPLLDHLLGKLIAGRWRRKHIRSGDTLFNVLDELCQGPDWEMRRRISEALSALGQIDVNRTLRIAKLLREDWDDSKMHSDVRRRVVEELRIPAWPGAPLLLDKFKTEDIASLLQLREKDQVYVAMAVCETLHEWEIIDPKRSGEIRNDLLEFCLRTFSQDELQAIKDLLELLELSKGKNILEVVQRLEEMSTSNNTFTRIAACRNVLLISDRFPSKALNLMRLFIDPGQHKHVRRPVAREESAAFLIKMIASKDCSLQANEILWDLLKDKDSTIRIAAFDMAEMLRDKNKDMLLQVCDFIAANESSAILMERAQHVRQELLTDSG